MTTPAIPFEQLRAAVIEERRRRAWKRTIDALWRVFLTTSGVAHRELVLRSYLAQARAEAFRRGLHVRPGEDPTEEEPASFPVGAAS